MSKEVNLADPNVRFALQFADQDRLLASSPFDVVTIPRGKWDTIRQYIRDLEAEVVTLRDCVTAAEDMLDGKG